MQKNVLERRKTALNNLAATITNLQTELNNDDGKAIEKKIRAYLATFMPEGEVYEKWVEYLTKQQTETVTISIHYLTAYENLLKTQESPERD